MRRKGVRKRERTKQEATRKRKRTSCREEVVHEKTNAGMRRGENHAYAC